MVWLDFTLSLLFLNFFFMKRLSLFLLCSLFLAGCGGAANQQPTNSGLASNLTQPVTQQSPEARNSLCDIVSAQRAGDIVRATLSVDVISPEDQPPLTCVYSGGGVKVTIMAVKGSDASERHAMNAEGVVAENIIADFESLGDGGTGFAFNDIVNGDVYQGNVWVNVSIESANMTEEEKTAAVKALIDMVLVAL